MQKKKHIKDDYKLKADIYMRQREIAKELRNQLYKELYHNEERETRS